MDSRLPKLLPRVWVKDIGILGGGGTGAETHGASRTAFKRCSSRCLTLWRKTGSAGKTWTCMDEYRIQKYHVILRRHTSAD